MDRNIASSIGCQGCFDSSVLSADLVMFWLAAGALLAAGLIPSRLAGRLLHLAAGMSIVVYVADLLVFRLFNYRLFLSDATLPEFLAGKPTADFDAAWGNADLFLRTAWEGTLPHVTEIRRFGRRA